MCRESASFGRKEPWIWGQTSRIGVGSRPWSRFLAQIVGGQRVHNPLLYAADQEVAIHRDRFQNLSLLILQDAWGVSFDPTLSYAQFI